MPGLAIAIGIILVLQGVLTYFVAAVDARSLTAFIPSLFGGLLVVCGFIAKKPDLRKHAMHAAAGVSLIGLLGALSRAVPAIINGKAIGLAIGSQLFMAVLLVIFLVLCIRSFIAARRAREAA